MHQSLSTSGIRLNSTPNRRSVLNAELIRPPPVLITPGAVISAVTADHSSRLTWSGGGLLSVASVALVQRVQVALNAEPSVHHRVLGAQVRLVEVVRVLHVTGAQTWGGGEASVSV